MAQDVLRIDGDGGGVGTDIDEGTAWAALSLSEYAVGQRQRSEVHLGHIDACRLETLVEVLIECLPLEDIQEVTFQMGGLDAHRVEL